jgi:hypothetical protein
MLPIGLLINYLIFYKDSCRVTIDYKQKERIPILQDQVGSSYYSHVEIPFLIIITDFYFQFKKTKRIFVITSEHQTQDVTFYLDSLNYILSLTIFSKIKRFFIVSDNASNIKSGYDLFNIFSSNNSLRSTIYENVEFVRINSWFRF